jgi:hypothetical protein
LFLLFPAAIARRDFQREIARFDSINAVFKQLFPERLTGLHASRLTFANHFLTRFIK